MWVLIVVFAGLEQYEAPSGFTQEFNTPKACIDAKAVIDSYKVDDKVYAVCLPKGGVK